MILSRLVKFSYSSRRNEKLNVWSINNIYLSTILISCVGFLQVEVIRENHPYGSCQSPAVNHSDISVYEKLYPVVYSNKVCLLCSTCMPLDTRARTRSITHTHTHTNMLMNMNSHVRYFLRHARKRAIKNISSRPANV